MHREWHYLPAVLIAAAGAIALIAQWGAARPLWLDEEMIALNLRDRTVIDYAGRLLLAQGAPFGWLVLQRAVVVVFGTSELALRAVPVLFGIGTIGVALWAGRREMGPVGAAVLTSLCSSGGWLTHYWLELKPYSADTFFALLLPALVPWALDWPGGDRQHAARRVTNWWLLAAVAHWFAYGATIVTPGCAVVLTFFLWRRIGPRAIGLTVVPLATWLASFGLHYLLSIRHTLGHEFLQGYWAFAFPPAGAGPAQVFAWLGSRLEPLADKPGGTTLWQLFWVASASGLVAGALRRPALGLSLASVPLTAMMLGSVRLVPLFERLSLWIVPALYAGIAWLADDATRRLKTATAGRRAPAWSVAGIAALVAAPPAVDIVREGVRALDQRPRNANHQLDDRRAVHWLMAQRTGRSAVLTTHLALPAVWWYGGVSIAAPAGTPRDNVGSAAADIYEVLVVPGRDCSADDFRTLAATHDRALIYLGFRFDDVPKGFDEWLLGELGRFGTVAGMRPFADVGRAVVIELRATPHPSGAAARPSLRSRTNECLAVRPARRW